jgi:predicted ArsR family transcriptional regulator
MAELTDAKRRLIERLKRVDSATAPELAATFDITDTAARQHLEALEVAGLVERFAAMSEGRGRPPTHWKLTPLASDLFPNRHGELTVELIGAIRDAMGDDGIEQVIASRTARQLVAYRSAIPAGSSIAVRVRRLAEVRSVEGYLAEAVVDGDATLLIEHHCPICDAAATCQGLCRAELSLFQSALGDDVIVERTAHLLSGDARCAYRISPKI